MVSSEQNRTKLNGADLNGLGADLGWHGIDRDSQELQDLRGHLLAHSGLNGLEVLDPADIERAVMIFRRDGFVMISDVMTPDQLSMLQAGVVDTVAEIVGLDTERGGNRGSHRYSFGGSSNTRSMLHRPEWQMLLELPIVEQIVSAIFESPDYMLRSGSGDFCLPGAVDYQPLHTDMGDWRSAEETPFSAFRDPRGHLTTRDLPCPYVCLNFLPFDQHQLNGPTRQIPGSQHSRAAIPSLEEEPEWMRLSTVTPAPAGSVQVRDVRAWHGGTPNLSDEIRAIPNLEFYAPWFREPVVPGISRIDYDKLSAHGRRVAQFCVADSADELDIGFEVKPFKRRFPRK